MQKKKWCCMSQYFTDSHLLQHFLVLQPLYNVTTDATWKINLSREKIVLLLGVSACRATSFDCLRHIHHSLRQSTSYPSITSKLYSLSYFEHSSNWYFSIHSLWRYIIIEFITESMFLWTRCHVKFVYKKPFSLFRIFTLFIRNQTACFEKNDFYFTSSYCIPLQTDIKFSEEVKYVSLNVMWSLAQILINGHYR